MIKNLKVLGVAAVVAVSAPVAALAATISGQIDISGNIDLDNSDFSMTGNADLDDTGIVLGATGDFSDAGLGFGSLATFTDIDFSAPGTVWEAGIFTFTATSFDIVDAGTAGFGDFTANGIVSAAGFEDTNGVLGFSTQDVGGQKTTGVVSFSTTTVAAVPVPAGLLLLGTALASLGMTRRKKA